MTFDELELKILDWMIDRDLDDPENAPKQYMKFAEESGELARGILKTNREEIIDAIGDVLVTLIILSYQLDVDPVTCLEIAWETIKNRTGKTENGTFIKD